MEFAVSLLLYIAITAVTFMIIGLFFPWAMLWWEDIQNRRKILKLYGGIAGCFFLLYSIAKFFI